MKIKKIIFFTVVSGAIASASTFLYVELRQERMPNRAALLNRPKPTQRAGGLSKTIQEKKEIYQIKHQLKEENSISFAKNSELFGYVAVRNGREFAVINGNEETSFESISTKIAFSPDADQYVYVGTIFDQKEKIQNAMLILNGKEVATYNDIRQITFNEDGSQLAYAALKRDRWFVVLNGKELGSGYEEVSDLTFSKKGERFAFRGKIGDREYTFYNEAESNPYSAVSKLTFSEDGIHFAFNAKVGLQQFVVYDGQELRDYEESANPVFFADNKLSYRAKKGREYFLVEDGKQGISYEEKIGSVTYDAEGRHSAYSIVNERNAWFPIVNNLKGPGFSMIGLSDYLSPAFYFSADGKRLAYPAQRGLGNYVMMLDQKELSSGHDGIVDVSFSADGQHLAYVALKENKKSLVIDGLIGEQFENIYDPHFLPDGSRYIYKAKSGDKLFIVIESFN